MDWKADREARLDPVRLTEQLRDSVPVLKFLDWRIESAERGQAVTILPLNLQSSNQHVTHQAAITLLAADYAAGIALASLLYGIPIVGIHEQETDYAAHVWGVKAEVKWITPSTGDQRVIARIPEPRHDAVLKRFLAGKLVVETVHVEMFNDAGPVAEADITYVALDSYALRRNAGDAARVNPLYEYKRTTSARLVAGFRALEHDKPGGMFDDPLAGKLARKHGMLMAERFTRFAPEAQPMVAARTAAADALAKRFDGLQLVSIGAGLDTRTYRLGLSPETRSFNLDLPRTLERRRRELDQLGQPLGPNAIDVPIDLLEVDPGPVLLAQPGFDPAQPVAIIWDGGSMYLKSDRAEAIIASLAPLLVHEDSRLWLDYIAPEVLTNSLGRREIDTFLSATRTLGEPFFNAFGDIAQTLGAAGLELVEKTRAAALTKSSDPLYELYRFAVAKRA
ncbi:MAG: SAM-dependent methyltransferase [Hyphomicrobiales bacterium]|nr:MAG: SAM-dependent methyltransferase [Hyphomicrobiales bacterium]